MGGDRLWDSMGNLQIGSWGPFNLQMSSRVPYLNIGSNTVQGTSYKGPKNPIFKDSMCSYLKHSSLLLLAANICHSNGFEKRMHK